MPNTYVALRTETVATATNSVTFNLSGISGYTDLVVVVSGQVASAGIVLKMQFNSDTASNYSMTELYGTGSSAASARRTSQTSIETSYNLVNFDNGNIGNALINVMNYSNATTYKTVLARTNSPSATYPGTVATVGLWRSTAAINSITLFAAANFAVGSTFSLYGIANADQGAAKATGGIITEDSQYWYHTFGASGAFVPKQSLTCDVLVVAGGGGGGYTGGGGGGAGGLLYQTGRSFTATTYNITVGGGGAGGVNDGNAGTVGVNSTLDTITANGGGGGANAANGNNGGSGGGAGWQATYTGGTATQGNSGGATGYGNAGGGNTIGSGAPNYTTAGGGGAGAVGGNAVSANVSGAGGVGLSGLTIAALNAMGAATSTGQLSSGNYYYAGGGGGSNGSTNGAGGLGGGATGASGGRPAGTTNTGGGGGGGGGNGGSGIVIIRYSK